MTTNVETPVKARRGDLVVWAETRMVWVLGESVREPQTTYRAGIVTRATRAGVALQATTSRAVFEGDRVGSTLPTVAHLYRHLTVEAREAVWPIVEAFASASAEAYYRPDHVAARATVEGVRSLFGPVIRG